MDIQLIVIGFAIISLTLVAAQWLSPLVHLPTPTVQLLLGAVVANSVIALGFDTGLRFTNFHDMVFYLFLPLLVYTAAWEINAVQLRQNIIGISALAVAGLLITTGLTAVVLFFAINHPVGFPWEAAILTGVLLAATDPAAVTSQAWIHHVRPKLALLLEGESLFNDATAVVLFTVVLGIATAAGSHPDTELFGSAAITFARELVGGAIIGLLAGILAWPLVRRATLNMKLWAGLGLALGTYHVCLATHTSGVIACLVVGLLFGRHSGADKTAANSWKFIADTTNGMLFILMGATITWAMFSQRWLAMVFAIAAVIIARFVSVHLVLAPQNRYLGTPYSWSDRHMTGLLGMRGAITIALVLVLPVDLPYWWTIQSIAYGVVLFDLTVTAPLMPLILGKT